MLEIKLQGQILKKNGSFEVFLKLNISYSIFKIICYVWVVVTFVIILKQVSMMENFNGANCFLGN